MHIHYSFIKSKTIKIGIPTATFSFSLPGYPYYLIATTSSYVTSVFYFNISKLHAIVLSCSYLFLKFVFLCWLLSFSFSLSDIWFFCWGVCNFLSSVLSKQKFEAMDGPVLQLRVTAQFYLESKGKYILEAWGHADPKDVKGREAPGLILVLFLYVFSPPPGPALCKLGWQGGLFVSPEVLTPVLGPSFVLFSRAFPFLVF